MQTTIKYFITCLFIMIIVSCKESNFEQKDKITMDSALSSTRLKNSNSGSIEDISFPDTTELSSKAKEYLAKQTEKATLPIAHENNIQTEKLIEILPKSIVGFEKLPNTSGQMVDDDGYVITTAKGEYKSGKQSVIIDIFDYGKNPKIPNIEMYDNPPMDLEAPAEQVLYKGARGFKFYDDKHKYMRVELLLINRYVIILRLNNPGDERHNATKYLDLINFDNLIKLGK